MTDLHLEVAQVPVLPGLREAYEAAARAVEADLAKLDPEQRAVYEALSRQVDADLARLVFGTTV